MFSIILCYLTPFCDVSFKLVVFISKCNFVKRKLWVVNHKQLIELQFAIILHGIHLFTFLFEFSFVCSIVCRLPFDINRQLSNANSFHSI